MILSCSNIKKSYGIDVVLENISFHIEEGEKIAIIGVNGAGKSTLFKIITGEIQADFGDIIIPKEAIIGYFSQNIEIDSNKTIYEEMLTVFADIIEIEKKMSKIEKAMASAQNELLDSLMKQYSALSHKLEIKNGYEYKSRIRGVIKGLGFSSEESASPINHLSGGQKTRVALGKLLLKSPDILLLDEPTNHLDIESINWLEDFLRTYPKSIMLISHDRYFIDKTASKIVEIENKKSKVYNGNYTFYAAQKEKNRAVELSHYLNQQKEIKHQEDVIKRLRSFNREKSIKRAESREKLLDKMEVLEKPENLPEKMKFSLKPKNESGFDVLSVSDLKKSFTSDPLFQNISFEIKKGEKVALIGPNGVGKTTLFKIILSLVKPTEGTVKLGSNVTIGYYDQEHSTLDTSKTIFNEISDEFPKLTNSEIRNVLAAFVFTGDDVFKPIEALSGGEKGRVALAKIMLSNANFLILDEPTNHLDINSKEILENAIRNYEGTCLYISHDRYFINNTAEKIIELAPNKIITYLGNYDYYLEKKAEYATNTLTESEQEKNENVSKNDWKKQKELQAEERKRQTQIKKTEKEIEETELLISDLDAKLLLEEVYTNPSASKEIFEQKCAAEEKLNILYEEWENLSD